MRQTLTDIIVEQAQEKEKYFQNYLTYAEIIKKEAEKILGETKVFLFGSILLKNEVPRDIDLLIVSPKFQKYQEKRKLISKIWQKIGILSPFELHLVTPNEYQHWYRYFLKGKRIKKI